MTIEEIEKEEALQSNELPVNPSCGGSDNNNTGVQTPAPVSDNDEESKRASRLKEVSKKFNPRYRTSCIWLKIYPEYIGMNEKAFPRNIISTHMSDVLHHFTDLCTDSGLSVHAIIHDEDTSIQNRIDLPKHKALHAHVLIFADKRFHMSAVLNAMAAANIDVDDAHYNNFMLDVRWPDKRKREHVRTIVYHTHETQEAKDKQKHVYSRDKAITNIALDTLAAYYTEFFTMMDHVNGALKERMKLASLDRFQKANINQRALEYGQTGADFDDFWFNEMHALVRTHDDVHKSALQHYARGLRTYLEGPASLQNIRCAIFINGDADGGKTYNSIVACKQLVGNCYDVDSGKTGKFDDLRNTHKSMVVSDTSLPDILAAADNKFVRLYRRNENNPVWSGQYLIITYNGSLDDYLDKFYLDSHGKRMSESRRKAIHSRFYECILSDGVLKLVHPSTRGDADTQHARNVMFSDFYKAFTASLSTYVKSEDFDSVSDLQSLCGIEMTAQPATVAPSNVDFRACVACKYHNPAASTQCSFLGSPLCSASKGGVK